MNGKPDEKDIGGAHLPQVPEEVDERSPEGVHLPFLARRDGITPLIMAAAMNHDSCVDILLSAGIDPNEESKVCLIIIKYILYLSH